MKKIYCILITLITAFGTLCVGVSASETNALDTTALPLGYMILAMSDQDNAAVKMLTAEGTVKEYPIAQTVKSNVNGIKSYTAGELLQYGEFAKPVAVLYEIGDGLITAIYLPVDYKNKRPQGGGDFALYYADGTARLASPLIGKYTITDDTIIFRVPYADRKKDGDYGVCKKDDLEDGIYDVLVYNVNEDYTVGALVIREKQSARINDDAPVMIVDGVLTTGGEGEAVNIIRGYVDGKIEELQIDGDARIYEAAKWSDKNIRDMKAGDVIQYGLNYSGHISIYRVLFDIDKNYGGDFFEKHTGASSPAYNTTYAEIYTAYANVVNATNYAVIINSKNYDYSWDKAFPIKNANIYEYSKDGKQLKPVEGFKAAAGDTVFIRSKYINNAMDIIIFN